jgi:hypothetical protein
MKRPLLAVVAALLVAAGMAATANAARPRHFTGTFSDTFVRPAGEGCDFDQQISSRSSSTTSCSAISRSRAR